MANIKAAQSGVWSATTTWQGGVLPGLDDIAIANSYTVTIDQDISVQTLSNSTFGSSTAGGFFQIFLQGAGVTRNITMSLGLGGGDTYIGTTTGLLRISDSGGTVDFGSTRIAGGFGSNRVCLLVDGNTDNSGLTIKTTGEVVGGSNANAHAIRATSISNTFYLGDIKAISSAAALNVTSTASLNTAYVQDVNADASVAPSGAAVLWQGASGTLHTKNIYGSSTASAASAASVIIGNNFCSAYVDGEVVARAGNAFFSFNLGTFHFRGPLKHSAIGVAPVVSPNWSFLPATSNTYYELSSIEYSNPLGEKNTLTPSSVGPYPQESDVRDGVSYINGSSLGELDIPPASSVSFGVPSGEELGTSSLMQSDISTAEVALGVTLSEKLLNSATISSTGDQIAAVGGE